MLVSSRLGGDTVTLSVRKKDAAAAENIGPIVLLNAPWSEQKQAKDAENKSGNSLDAAAEKDAARRDREKLQRVVFRKDGDKVKMVKVETGIADNSHIQIKSGIKAGDEVVSGSYAAISRKLKDDMKVTIENPKKDDEKK